MHSGDSMTTMVVLASIVGGISCLFGLLTRSTWKYVGACLEGQSFQIASLNVWEHEWLPREGEAAHVRDPQYGEPRTFPVYNIDDGKRRITLRRASSPMAFGDSTQEAHDERARL
jgi:hypothetical protein